MRVLVRASTWALPRSLVSVLQSGGDDRNNAAGYVRIAPKADIVCVHSRRQLLAKASMAASRAKIKPRSVCGVRVTLFGELSDGPIGGERGAIPVALQTYSSPRINEDTIYRPLD